MGWAVASSGLYRDIIILLKIDPSVACREKFTKRDFFFFTTNYGRFNLKEKKRSIFTWLNEHSYCSRRSLLAVGLDQSSTWGSSAQREFPPPEKPPRSNLHTYTFNVSTRLNIFCAWQWSPKTDLICARSKLFQLTFLLILVHGHWRKTWIYQNALQSCCRQSPLELLSSCFLCCHNCQILPLKRSSKWETHGLHRNSQDITCYDSPPPNWSVPYRNISSQINWFISSLNSHNRECRSRSVEQGRTSHLVTMQLQPLLVISRRIPTPAFCTGWLKEPPPLLPQ